MSDFTTEQNLEKLTGASNPDETFNADMDNLEIGRTIYIAEYGEGVTQYEAICVVEADDLYYLADANDTSLQDVVGLATATKLISDEGFVYSNGALVTEATWDWDLSKPVFLSDTPGALTQTAGTNPIIIGIPTAPTKLLVAIINLNFQLAHIADPAAAAATTATTPGTGADATTWTGAQCTAAYNDLVALKSAVDANNTAIDSILARLELLRISATA